MEIQEGQVYKGEDGILIRVMSIKIRLGSQMTAIIKCEIRGDVETYRLPSDRAEIETWTRVEA